MISKSEKSAIISLLKDDRWEIILKIAAEFIDKWHGENKIGETEFETLKLAISNQSKIEALKEFLDFLEAPNE